MYFRRNQLVTFINLSEFQVIIINLKESMRRKSANETALYELLTRDTITKNKSPKIKKNKSKPKIELTSFLANHQNKHRKNKDDFIKIQSKAESNLLSTHCTTNKSKSNKSTLKKIKYKNNSKRDTGEEADISQNQIMNLINHYAVKIQRQWKTYQMRKKMHQIVSKQRLRIKSFKKRQHEIKNPMQLDLFKIEKQQDKSISEEIQQKTLIYNSNKYEINNSLSNLQIKSEIQQHSKQYQQQSSLDKRKSFDQSQNQFQYHEQNRRKSDNYSLIKKSNKILYIDKVLEIKIGQIFVEAKDNSKTSKNQNQRESKIQNQQQIKQKMNKERKKENKIEIKKDSKTGSNKEMKNSNKFENFEDDKHAFRKLQFKDMILKVEKSLEVKKLHNLLSMQNKYEKNEMTFRTYQKGLLDIQEEHAKQLKQLKIKEGQMKSHWMDVYNMYQNSQEKYKNISFKQAHLHSETSEGINQSISIDKWDFNSSSKKSQAFIQSFSDFGLNSHQKLESIEGVLKELDLFDDEKYIKSFQNQKNKFQKKKKHVNVIDAIAEERSKEISERSKEVSERSKEVSEKQQKEQKQIENEQKQIENEQKQIEKENNEYEKRQSKKLLTEQSQQSLEITSFETKNDLETKNEEGCLNRNKNQHMNKYLLKNRHQLKKQSIENKFLDISLDETPQAKQQKFLNQKIKGLTVKDQKYQKSIENQLFSQLNTDQRQMFYPQKQDEEDSLKLEQESSKLEEGSSKLEDDCTSRISSEVELKIQIYTNNNAFKNNENKGQMKDTFLNDFILRDFQLDQDNDLSAIEKLQNIEGLKQNEQKLEDQPKRQDEDILISRFRNLVEQRIVLYNIHIVNSIKFTFAKIQKVKQQTQQHLRQQERPKHCEIASDINAINTWLLQMSHFLLDNHQKTLNDSLIHVKQPPFEDLMKNHIRVPQEYLRIYQAIPEYMFKEFQFYYIKSLEKSMNISVETFQEFSSTAYIFHRALIDCLNTALLDELLTGKRWIKIPWRNNFHRNKKISKDYAKVCLERSINIVSNWGEYGMARLELPYEDIDEDQWHHFEQEKMILIAREEIFEIHLHNQFFEAHLLLHICDIIWKQELQAIAVEFMLLMAN